MSIASSASASGAQIPFWVQIVSVVLAPILGFAGVAAGATISEKNRRTAYFIEEKKKAYMEFIKNAIEFESSWSSQLLSFRKHGDIEPVKVPAFKMPSMDNLGKTASQIRLFGSDPVIEKADKYFKHTLTVHSTVLITVGAGFNRDEWSEMALSGLEIIEDFTKVARRDLGLSKLRKEQPKQDRSVWSKNADLMEEMAAITSQLIKTKPRNTS